MPHRVCTDDGSFNNDVLPYGMLDHIACCPTLKNVKHVCLVLSATVRTLEAMCGVSCHYFVVVLDSVTVPRCIIATCD
jgi:hypothetical protein